MQDEPVPYFYCGYRLAWVSLGLFRNELVCRLRTGNKCLCFSAGIMIDLKFVCEDDIDSI